MAASTAVFFDVDGTLVRLDRPYGEVLADAARAVGVEPTDALLEAYDEAFFERFEAFADEPYRDAATAAVEAAGVDADPGAFAEAVLDAEFAATVVPEGAGDLLDGLADRHRLGVLSNGVAAVQRGKLERHGLADYFDAHVYSYDVGAHKPDPGIYAAAAERLPADRHVYVADDREADVAPAREAGWLAVHVDDAAPDGTVRVGDLRALDALGRLLS